MSGARSLQSIFKTAHQQIDRLVDCPRFGITLFDEETSTLHVLYMMGDGTPIDDRAFPPVLIEKASPRRGRARAIYVQIPTIVRNMRGAPGEISLQIRASGDERLSESALYAPMVVNGHTIGLLEMQSYRIGAYEDKDISLVAPIASHVGLAIENARLISELEQERNTLSQRVRERTAELEEANRELQAFAYSVSHDLRAPLRAIDGFSEAIAEASLARLDGESLGYFRRIQDASRRMAQLIDDLLMLSRVSRREFVRGTVDLTAIAQEVAADLRSSDPAREVQFVIADGMSLSADGDLLGIALRNLMENAWKFTGECGHAKIEVSTDVQDGVALFYVKDNGVGFDMAYAGNLFSPFYRLHGMTEFPGTGIGLATVQRIVRRHGGRVWCNAVPGEGATFFFTLGEEMPPTAPADPERETTSP